MYCASVSGRRAQGPSAHQRRSRASSPVAPHLPTPYPRRRKASVVCPPLSLESNNGGQRPRDTKSQSRKAAGDHVLAPDCEGRNIARRHVIRNGRGENRRSSSILFVSWRPAHIKSMCATTACRTCRRMPNCLSPWSCNQRPIHTKLSAMSGAPVGATTTQGQIRDKSQLRIPATMCIPSCARGLNPNFRVRLSLISKLRVCPTHHEKRKKHEGEKRDKHITSAPHETRIS